MSPHAARGVPTPPAPKSGSVGTRFAQTADASLSDFGTGDVAPYTGTHVKGRGNGNFKSNGNGNGNGMAVDRRLSS